MYSITEYGEMIADRGRTDAYARALRQVIKPGCVVLDIGTGTGIFAMLACKYGAGRVYAVEPSDAIQVAREVAAANGYTDRIVFIQNQSTRINLPERAQVIVSDLRGVLPLFQGHLISIADARRRLLVPDGVLIPRCDTIWAAVVEVPELYRQMTSPWDNNGHCLDMPAARRIVVNTWRKIRVAPDQLLSEPCSWTKLDYTAIESPDVDAEVDWTAARAGTAHGACIWFDATLADGISFSNRLGAPELIYGQAFFPWSAPVALAVGDRVSVTLRADLVGDDYIWGWDTRVLDQGDPGRIKADFKQSTFFGVPLSPAQLRKRAASHVPVLDEDGQIDRQILALMDGEISLGEIARRIQDLFPARFALWRDALTRVGELSKKYSR
jgi:protein arginine N-methyltransferase 1